MTEFWQGALSVLVIEGVLACAAFLVGMFYLGVRIWLQ